MLDKRIRDDAPPLASIGAATAFVQQLARFPDATELAWKLVDTRKAGMARVREVARFAVSHPSGTTAGIQTLVLPLLDALVGPGRLSSALQDTPLAMLLEQVR